MPRQQCALDRVLGSPEETSLTGNEVAIVLMQRGGYPVQQGTMDYVLRVSVPHALTETFSTSTPFFRSSFCLRDSGRCGRANERLAVRDSNQIVAEALATRHRRKFRGRGARDGHISAGIRPIVCRYHAR